MEDRRGKWGHSVQTWARRQAASEAGRGGRRERESATLQSSIAPHGGRRGACVCVCVYAPLPPLPAL
eukprot:scaffold18895_cov30-Tisochrysis_lutea.AAC.1